MAKAKDLYDPCQRRCLTCVMCLLTSPCLPCLLLCGQGKLYRGKEKEEEKKKKKKGVSWSRAAQHQCGGPAITSLALEDDLVVPDWSRKDSDVSVGERDEVHLSRLQSLAFQQLVHIQHPRARALSGSSYASSQGEPRCSQSEPKVSQGEQRSAASSPAACLASGSGPVYVKQTTTSSSTGPGVVPLHHQPGRSESRVSGSRIAGGISPGGYEMSTDNSGTRYTCDSKSASGCLEHRRQGLQLEYGSCPADGPDEATSSLPALVKPAFDRQISINPSGISLPTGDGMACYRLGQISHICGSSPNSRGMVAQQDLLQESLSNKLTRSGSLASGRHVASSPHRQPSRVGSDSPVLKVHHIVTPSGHFDASGSVFANGEESSSCRARSAVTTSTHLSDRSPAAAKMADTWDWDFSTISDKREFQGETINVVAPGPLNPTPQDKETASTNLRGRFRVTPSQDGSVSLPEKEFFSSDKDLSDTRQSIT